MANTITLPEGALVSNRKMDQVTLTTLKGIGLNLVSLPHDTLYQLQDGIETELCARESLTVQVLSKKKINIEQLSFAVWWVGVTESTFGAHRRWCLPVHPIASYRSRSTGRSIDPHFGKWSPWCKRRDKKGAVGDESLYRQAIVEGVAFHSPGSQRTALQRYYCRDGIAWSCNAWLYYHVGAGIRGPHYVAGGPQHSMARDWGTWTPATIWQH